MIKWIKKIYKKWEDYFDVKELEVPQSNYMYTDKWDNPLCPICNLRLDYYDVRVNQQIVRKVVGCPSCDWVPSDKVD